MPRLRRLYANCQLPVELILYELRPNSPGGGYMPTTTQRRFYANKTIAKLPFLGRTLDRGPTKIACSFNISFFALNILFIHLYNPPWGGRGNPRAGRQVFERAANEI